MAACAHREGIQRADDARAVVDVGADAVVVSNHGGRQLDRAVASLDVLPGIAAAVGDRAEVLVDGGVTIGADIIAAIGARRDRGPGRPCIPLRLMAGGERGVVQALTILHNEAIRTLQLLGVPDIDTLGNEHVRSGLSGSCPAEDAVGLLSKNSAESSFTRRRKLG